MVVNFRIHGISRGAHKLARTPILMKKRMVDYKKFSNDTLNYFLIKKKLKKGLFINLDRE